MSAVASPKCGSMEENRIALAGKEFLLQGIQVLAEPMNFSLENCKASKNEIVSLAMISRFVKVENVHTKREVG